MNYVIGTFELAIMLAVSLIINFCLIVLVWQMLEPEKEAKHGENNQD